LNASVHLSQNCSWTRRYYNNFRFRNWKCYLFLANFSPSQNQP